MFDAHTLTEIAARARLVTDHHGQAEDSPVPSPCSSICRMDDDTGLCLGCLRSIDEITAWSRLSAPEQRTLWRHIGQRAEQHIEQGAA